MIQRHLIRQSRAIAPRWQALSRSSSLTQFNSRRMRPSSLRWREAPKWYSTTNVADAPPESETEKAQRASKEESPLIKELEAKDREIIDLKVTTPLSPSPQKLPLPPLRRKRKGGTEKLSDNVDMQDKYLRSVANFRNLQDITKRDIQTARDFAISKFATDLIESVDNFDRALATITTTTTTTTTNLSNGENGENGSSSSNKELQNLYDGLKMTEKILMQTLKKHGLERFDPSQEPGTKFDPRLHEATFQTKVEGKTDGDVIMVQQKGFMLNGRVLRVYVYPFSSLPFPTLSSCSITERMCSTDYYLCVSHYRLQRSVLRTIRKKEKEKSILPLTTVHYFLLGRWALVSAWSCD